MIALIAVVAGIAAAAVIGYVAGRIDGMDEARREIRDEARARVRDLAPHGVPIHAETDVDVMAQVLDLLDLTLTKKLRTEK